MRRILYFLRLFIISPEFVSLAIIALLTYLKPEYFASISSKIDISNSMVKWFGLLPAAITGIMIKRNTELLSPEPKELSASLLKWPEYYKLEYRFWACLFYGIFGSLACGGVLLFGNLEDHIILSIFLAGLIVSSITFITFLKATITVKQILTTFQ